MANISKIKLPDGVTYNLKDNISGYVTTDEKVTQTETTTNAAYEVLLSGTTGNTTKIEGARKNNKLAFNPSSGRLSVDNINGVYLNYGSGGVYIGSGDEYPVLGISGNDLYISNENDEYLIDPAKFSIATNTREGFLKPWYYHTAASTGPTTGSDSTAVTVNSITTTAGKYYAVESDSSGRLFVNVPWSGGSYQSGTAAMLLAGTNTTDSVWTPKILHDYVQSAVGSIGYVSKTENTYTTSSSSISTIPIGISEYTSTDLLLVDINGLDLIQGTDYTVSGTNIVLTTPITTSGTKVHFVDFKLVTATVSDIATLKGDAAGFGTVNATIDSGTGTPSVTVTTTGPDTAKNFSFAFHNLKGTDGTNGTHTISYTPIVTGGAQIGTITIDNTNYPLYAPAVVWG